jgi:hypothetical protein
MAPVDAPFERISELPTAPSNVNASVSELCTESCTTPTVATQTRRIDTPCASLPRSDDSDVQAVTSELVPANRVRPEYAAAPTRDPSNVTLAAPVAAKFDVTMLLGCRPSNEKVRLADPSARPAVTTAHFRNSCDRWPIATLHASDDADVHVVVSECDAPKRPAEDAEVVATLEPSTVTLDAPVVAPFERIRLLGPDASTVNERDSVPCCSPTLATPAREPITVIADAADFTATAESAVHSVSSLTEPPTRRTSV